MSGDFSDAVGSMVEGAMVARAVEPRAGEGDAGHTHESACLNCGAALAGPYCHECGQHAHVRRTLGAFFHDFLHGVVHFEGKTWRTLPLLAWQPGKLTREYIDGRRASYVSPVALFLFVTFLMFAVFKTLGGPIDFGDSGVVTVGGKKETVAAAQQDLGGQLKQLEAERAAALAAGKPTGDIDGNIKGTQAALDTVNALQAGNYKEAADRLAGPPADGNGALTRLWNGARANPELTIYKVQTNAYKYSWLLIVISVPFVWLLFAWRRRFNLYDHTVFVTYSLSFMMLALTLASLGAAFGVALLVLVPLLYAPFHIYRQLRGTYDVGRGGALVRTVLLLAFAFVALTLWAAVLVGLAVE